MKGYDKNGSGFYYIYDPPPISIPIAFSTVPSKTGLTLSEQKLACYVIPRHSFHIEIKCTWTFKVNSNDPNVYPANQYKFSLTGPNTPAFSYIYNYNAAKQLTKFNVSGASSLTTGTYGRVYSSSISPTTAPASGTIGIAISFYGFSFKYSASANPTGTLTVLMEYTKQLLR